MKPELLVQFILRFKDGTYTVVISPLDHLDATLGAANRNEFVSHYELHGLVQGHENADVVLAALRDLPTNVVNPLVAEWVRFELISALAVVAATALDTDLQISDLAGFDWSTMQDFNHLLTTLRVGLSV